MNSINGLLPGWVASYDGPGRSCRVRIDGLTDGSDTLPLAVFCNPIGDRATDGDGQAHTEILVKVGDPVWLMFEGGDPRFPIIMGYRTPRRGAPTGWRRWKHPNIEVTADNVLRLNCAKLEINVSGDMSTTVGGAMNSEASTSRHQAATHRLQAQTTIAGAIATAAGPGGAGATLTGPVAVQGGALTHDGKNVGSTHTHREQGDGQLVSGPQ